MLHCLLTAAAVLAPPAPGSVRAAGLDSLAADILRLGAIPEGADMILLYASEGWPSPLGGVTELAGDEDPASAAAASGHPCWGYAALDGEGILVTAPLPACVPVGLPFAVEPGDTVRFGLEPSLDAELLVMDPGGGFREPPGDSAGSSFVCDSEGVYWLEAVRGDPPSVLFLLPILSGTGLADALSGRSGIPSSRAATLGRVSEQLDSMRLESGLEPLAEDAGLESTARERAYRLAISGGFGHPDGLDDSLSGCWSRFAENVSGGSGLDEAWSMILISPFHMRTCLDSSYSSAGMAMAAGVGLDGWRIILVQVFAGGAR